MLSTPVEVASPDQSQGLCEAVADLTPGLYRLTALVIGTGAPQPGSIMPRAHRIQAPELFEIRATCGVPPRTLPQLETAYQAALISRQEHANAGIGSGPVATTVLLFVKHLLMTKRLNLDTCQIIPLDPVGWYAETQSVDQFFDKQQLPRIKWSEEMLRQIQRAEPATLIYFPVVRAGSIDECGKIALNEALLLNILLAAHRGSLGEIFCTAILQAQPSIGLLYSYGLHIPPYRGNLMGGEISGEEPDSIRRNMSALRNSPTIQLYLTLLGEALGERRPEFKYVRFWSLLETIAKSKRLAGQPTLSWTGHPELNDSGQRSYITGARGEVYELLRRYLAPGFSDQSFAAGLTYGKLSEQATIWYRRRNCTAHGDPGCVCRDPSKAASARGTFVKCFASRSDDQAGFDRYLSNLQDITVLVVFKLLREGWPSER